MLFRSQYQRAIDYLADLDKEVNLLMPHLGPAQVVSQVHLGGGTPTFFRDKELHQLMGLLQSRFQWQKGGEFAIEVDPRTVDGQRLQTLWSLGFNRLSLGVQDFDPQVQEAVHRVQSVDQVRGLMDRAREIGFSSINLDLIHGLPRQTMKSWQRTLDQLLTLKPDRLDRKSTRLNSSH